MRMPGGFGAESVDSVEPFLGRAAFSSEFGILYLVEVDLIGCKIWRYLIRLFVVEGG